MPVTFDFDKMHEDYREPVESVFTALHRKYPQVELQHVVVKEERPGDHSLADANVKGRVALNAYWFTQPIAMLRNAGLGRKLMPLGDGKTMAYHGAMVEEPLHVLTHEFGHTVASSLPPKVWQPFACACWREACRDTDLAPAAYAFTNPSEYFAELFASAELEASESPHVEYLRRFLAAVQF